MLKTENIIRICGLVSLILLSASLISYTSKSVFKSHKAKALSAANLIYDPELNLRMSHICIFSKDVYRIAYNSTSCYNKTLLQWYNPWVKYHLWKKFKNQLDVRLQIRQTKTIEANLPLLNQTMEIKNEEETIAPTLENSLEKESRQPLAEKGSGKTSEITYTILVGLLVASAMVAFWEVFKVKIRKNQMKNSKSQEKECSLADFTINRHLRRESNQQNYGSPVQGQAPLEMAEKVTRTLVHQSSLDRTFPKPNFKVNASEMRRNSAPLQLMTSSPLLRDSITIKSIGGPSSNSPLRINKRQSIQIVKHDFSLEQKKKPTHFIRRH